MNTPMIELYTDYLISSFGQTTATGLSSMLDGDISHDKVTRFLSKEPLTSKQLWQQVKPVVRQVSQESDDVGVLIFDDPIRMNQQQYVGIMITVSIVMSKVPSHLQAKWLGRSIS